LRISGFFTVADENQERVTTEAGFDFAQGRHWTLREKWNRKNNFRDLAASVVKYQLEGAFMPDVRRGLIIVNTGPGKGKTTAAMGTALRAVGNGMKVLMLQFLKGSWHYGELDAVMAFGDSFIMKQMGRGFVKVGGAETDPEDVRMVEEAWNEAEQAIYSGVWDLVILDEINYAISYKMLDPEKVVAVLQKKPEMVHVILTGRNAHPSIIEIADTVTEMREIKHAYTKGIEAQRGIEY
jgi:cob(I)alamin adenosyltransferase